MRYLLGTFYVGVALMAAAVATPAAADTCSGRAAICRGACTPDLVSSGRQAGGTVKGCLASCNSRLGSCMKTGIWVHMGSQTRGMRQKVDRQ